MKLDWSHWLYGLIAGFIGGGAGAFGAGFGGIITDPEHFNAAGGAHHLLVLMGWTFLFSGIITVLAYLKQSPLPPVVPDSTTTSVGVTTQPGAQPKTTTTVSETHTVPNP
jgi:hypothetical protein